MRQWCCLGLVLVGISATGVWAEGTNDDTSLSVSPASKASLISKGEAAAVSAFTQLNPATEIYRSGSRITRVWGRAFAYGASVEESAAGFASSHAEMFGVPAEDLLPVSRVMDGANMVPVMYDPQTGQYKFTLVYYSHFKDGVPVFRSQLKLLVLNQADNPVVWAGSTLHRLGDFAVDQVLARAAFDPQAMGTGMTNFTAPETVIWAGAEDAEVSPVLAVSFIGDNYGDPNTQKPERWLYVCDAATGEVLYQENMIIFTDVTGNVSGMATPGPKSDNCENEVLMAMPYAKATIGATTAYADVNGDFTIPNAGSSPVTVQSPMSGLYFVVDDVAGAEELLSQSVTPPGPADFVHNQANTSALIRAQVNGYIQANVVRDFTLTYNPSYPTISTQTNWPVNVNQTGGYCPGNAWYDGSSINFCQAGSGYPNTAWSSVVYHEYGHHMVATGGSGQGQYGEGMGDCMSVLILDDPVVGYGFFGSCATGLRNAENTKQYPCSEEIHECGNLLSGCVWDTRQELAITEPVNGLAIISNLTVNSILLHDGDLITPTITIDFLTLDDTDGNIGNGTPHRTEICTGFGLHNMDCPPLDVGMSVGPSSDFLSTGQPGGPFTPGSMVFTIQNLGPTAPINYQVTKTASWLDLANASGTLQNVGDTAQVTITINAGANSLPDGDYFDTLHFYNTTNGIGDTTRQATLRVGINDDCAYAKRACPGQTYTGTTSGMTQDGTTTCGTANTTPDVWYKYTPETSGSATFSLCSGGTNYDSVMSLHSACPGTSGNSLNCDDDACGGGGPSQFSLAVTAGTTYYIRVSGWNGATGNYALTITGPACLPDVPLTITLPGGTPSTMPPGTPMSFDVIIANGVEVYVPDTAMLHYRYDGGSFLTAPLTPIGGTLFQATLPAADCDDVPEFYVSAQGDGGSTVTKPDNAPTAVFTADMGALAAIVDNAFELDEGWTVGAPGDTATLGVWTRNDPEGTTAQPEDDTTAAPGVNCWVTDYRAGANVGSFDVDGGKTTLVSPTLDLAAYPDAKVSYWRWFCNDGGGAPDTDTFVIEISNNGGASWVNAETIGPSGPQTDGGWFYREFLVASKVTPTSQVKMRFIAQDQGTGSIVEAAIDDFKVMAFDCQPVCPTMGDFTGDGAVDGLDLQGFTNALIGTFHPCADFNGSGQMESGDIEGMLIALGLLHPAG